MADDDMTQTDWDAVPAKDLERVYDLMKRQGTRELPIYSVMANTDEEQRRRKSQGWNPYCCCPICGHEFDPVREANVCPTTHYGEQVWTPEELITADDDYAWVE